MVRQNRQDKPQVGFGQAQQKFHELMAQPEASPQPEAVAAIIDLFLDWMQKNRAPRTYDWNKIHLQSFLDALEPKTLTVGKLNAHHVHACR